MEPIAAGEPVDVRVAVRVTAPPTFTVETDELIAIWVGVTLGDVLPLQPANKMSAEAERATQVFFVHTPSKCML